MTSVSTPRPSALSAFLSGGKSGLFSGVVMASIIAIVSPLIPGLGAMGLAGAALMVTASTLFGGIMSTKRAVFDTPHAGHAYVETMVPVPVPTYSGPVMAPMMTMADAAPEQATGKSWVADTGRSEGPSARIQQILADGSLSDKDRASAILASREAADQQASRA